MKVLFLTMTLSLFSILQAEESTSSEEVFEGTYHINAVVGDKEFPEEKRPKALSPLTITQLNDGNTEAKFTMRENGKCKEIKVKLEKTDNPNKFTIRKGTGHVYVTKTSVPDNWILFCESEVHGEQIKMAKLLGPKTEVNPEAMKEYQEFIKDKGFKERKIFSPKQEEGLLHKCLKQSLLAQSLSFEVLLGQMNKKRVTSRSGLWVGCCSQLSWLVSSEKRGCLGVKLQMKVLFLTIALSLCSILQAQELSPFEGGFGGTYFIKAVVADKEHPGEKKPKDMSPLRITDLSNGNLEAKFTINMHGKCKEIKAILEKTDEPGQFSTDGGKRHVHIEGTSVMDHWIIFCEGELHGKQIRIAKLVGQNAEENPEAFEDYKKFVSLKGFKEEKIQIPRQTETCTPEHA
ncbi:uncharacterized protein LOC122739060 [Dromiciops gliroides]|uniref:uncharacterized protein LOC122739060 n=1 Tax=Dromiciops gliroides TaxID=33562 RepID=UPI001CC37F0E|nr:uncharacterized protein LOC122739060 [Dromiciops gliroides]